MTRFFLKDGRFFRFLGRTGALCSGQADLFSGQVGERGSFHRGEAAKQLHRAVKHGLSRSRGSSEDAHVFDSHEEAKSTRKIFHRASSRESDMGYHRSPRTVTGGRCVTAKHANCFYCDRTRHKRREYWRQISAGASPETQAGMWVRAAGSARSRPPVGGTLTSIKYELEAGTQRTKELERFVVAIERLSDAFQTHVDTFLEGRCESAATDHEPKRQLP